MNLKCFVFGHESRFTVNAGRWRTVCGRCDHMSKGIAIGTTPPVVLYAGVLPHRIATGRIPNPKVKRSRFWLRGVFAKSG